MIRKIIFTLSFLSIFSATNISYLEKCRYQSNFFCKLSQAINTPGNILIRGFNDSIGIIKHINESKKFTLYGSHSKAQEPLETKKRFKNLLPGFNFNYEPGERQNAGYLLLSRFAAEKDGDPSIELWDMNNQKMLKSYDINFESIKKGLNSSNLNNMYFHPLVLEDGSILLNSMGGWSGPIVKIDNCGNYLSHNSEYPFHHSLEIDNDGNIYSPINNSTKNLNKIKRRHAPSFSDHGYAILDKNLKIKKTFSMLDLYSRNNFLSDVYGGDGYSNNPFHLNDVKPFKNKNGNTVVLLSLLTQSSVIAHEVEEDKIIWKIDRSTIHQHDVDILSQEDGVIDISIFDNRTLNYLKQESLGNQIVILRSLPTYFNEDFLLIADEKSHSEYNLQRISFDNLEKDLIPKTRTGGRSDFLKENNSLMVEETDYGRLFEIDLDNNNILWQYINKEKKDRAPFMMNWSRRFFNLPDKSVNELNQCKKK